MTRALAAGTLYFAIVFAAGFILGLVRVLLIAPATGGTASVLIEVPVMLAMAWLACGWTLRRTGVPSHRGNRVVMGAAAFALLLLAEAGVSVVLAGRTLLQHLESYREAGALIGLAAQLLYAMFPLLRRRRFEVGRTNRAGAE